MEWFISNKEWLFSGIGVFCLTLIISFLLSILKRIKNRNTEDKNEYKEGYANKSNIITGNNNITYNIVGDNNLK